MRWGLAFTPIYALLSEGGGDSIRLTPLPLIEPYGVEGLKQSETGSFEDEMMDGIDVTSEISSSVETRVLLAVSVSESAPVDVAQWIAWLTTQTPGYVTEIGVRLESVFTSHSSLVIVSVPTHAWVRLPETSAYQFIGFIKSGNLLPDLQATSSVATQVPKKVLPTKIVQDNISHDSGYRQQTSEIFPFYMDDRAPPSPRSKDLASARLLDALK